MVFILPCAFQVPHIPHLDPQQIPCTRKLAGIQLGKASTQRLFLVLVELGLPGAIGLKAIWRLTPHFQVLA